MPKRTKEIKQNEENLELNIKTTVTNKSVKKATPLVKNSSKKSTTKAQKKQVPVSSTSTKKTNTTTKKKTDLKTKKNTKNIKSKKIVNSKKAFSPEYYDLPYRYNQTIVKILAQTPKTLFVYWDISDKDKEIYKKQYGEHFFEITKPVLIVHNDTMDYSFEIDINDFANSWYLKVNDSNCNYRIELGRRPIPINYSYLHNINKSQEIKPIQAQYIYITSSNEIASPNNKILFENINSNIYFKNVKTNEVICKNISDFTFISNIGRFYNIYDLYKQFYKDEELLTKEFDLRTVSSGNPSSGSISSKFK